jgi:3D (Asp-Asp-Asp) domain-containing protein
MITTPIENREIEEVKIKEEFASAHDPIRERILLKRDGYKLLFKKKDVVQEELDRLEEERIKKEEAEKMAAEKKEREKQKREASLNKVFKLSFYTTLPEENGGHANMANGKPITGAYNVLASNYYPLGTKIYLEGFGTMVVSDRGGSAFNSPDRLDVLIQRREGESVANYKARVRKLGRQQISGKIVD